MKLTKAQVKRIFEIYSTKTDLTSAQKADILNSEFSTDYDESAFRKRWASMKEGIDLYGTAQTAETLAEMEIKAQLSRKKAANERKLLNKELSKMAIHGSIIEAIDNYTPYTKGIEITQPPIINKEAPAPVYVIGDEHYRGKQDDAHIKKLFCRINHDVVNNRHSQITLVFLGDNIEGLLHKSSIVHTPDGIINQALQYCDIAIPMIDVLTRIASVRILFVTQSNHGQIRPLGSTRNEFPRDDVGYIIERLIRNNVPRATVISGAEIMDKKTGIFAFHGHQQWASTGKSIMSQLQERGHNPSLIIMGHYHNYKLTEHNNATLIVAPAVKREAYDYEKIAGYHIKPAILKITKDKDITTKLMSL